MHKLLFNMKLKYQKYPLMWGKDDFFIKIYSSIPNISTGILITTNNATFVVDPGDGILRDLSRDIGADSILKISDIFITHGHHDHIGGVWSLLTYLSVMQKKNEINIFYPKGCVEIESIYNAFLKVYKKDLTYKLNLREIRSEKTFKRKSILIKPFEVNHREISIDKKSSVKIPSLGFKFIYNKKSICYGGDTAYCESLIKHCKNSDLAIIEAGADSENKLDLHMSIDQASQIGKTAKHFFLVHVPE